jgi:hypothetical protein
MFRLKCEKHACVSALALVVLLLAMPTRSEAASISYVIDLSFPFDPSTRSSLGVQGEFFEAGRFQIDSALLPADRVSFVSYSQLEAFSLSLPTLSLAQGDKDGGSCLTGIRPACGLLFVGMEPLSLVGQFSIGDPVGRFHFRFDNTGPAFLGTDAPFQSVSIEDLDAGLRATVASGFARIRQPVPEPSSILLLTTGGLAVGHALRRRKRSAAAA